MFTPEACTYCDRAVQDFGDGAEPYYDAAATVVARPDDRCAIGYLQELGATNPVQRANVGKEIAERLAKTNSAAGGAANYRVLVSFGAQGGNK